MSSIKVKLLCTIGVLAGVALGPGCGGSGHNPPPEEMNIDYPPAIKEYVMDLARTKEPSNFEVLIENLNESSEHKLGGHAETIAKLKDLAQQCEGKVASPEGKAIIDKMGALAKTLPGDVEQPD